MPDGNTAHIEMDERCCVQLSASNLVSLATGAVVEARCSGMARANEATLPTTAPTSILQTRNARLFVPPITLYIFISHVTAIIQILIKARSIKAVFGSKLEDLSRKSVSSKI